MPDSKPVNTANPFLYSFGEKTYDLSARTYVMGILNVTPDSFSDGGKYLDPADAVSRALQMIDEGADFIDVGGESTRPGAGPVPLAEELNRVLPVISALAGKTDTPISVDTYKPQVAMSALDAGAVIVNDISGMAFDDALAKLAREMGASIVLMHMKGEPRTMQNNPAYDNLWQEVIDYLQQRIEHVRSSGLKQIIIDPGIGFGKRPEHNLEILKNLSNLKPLGYPILIGASRKSFIGKVLDLQAEDRLEGSLAAAVVSVMNGASIVRVHDVKETKRAVAIAD
ncbi:MAG: dihydropteroate synthase, partial [bacterium]